MNRFFCWSIYGGTFLLSMILVAASVMAVVGFVPFRPAQSAQASEPGGDSSVAAGRGPSPSAELPPHHDRSATVRRAVRGDDTGGWDTVWQASSESAGADRIHNSASMQHNPAAIATHPEPVQAAAVAVKRDADESAPDAPPLPGVHQPAGLPDDPRRDDWNDGTPPIVAGLWPALPLQPEETGDDPADPPEVEVPAGDGGGDGDGDQFDDKSPRGPLRLSLVPGADEVAAGTVVSVRVVLSDADRISSVPFHVRFNSEVLEYVGATKGPAILNSPVQPILLAAVHPARPDDLAVGLALFRSAGRFSGSGTVVVLDFRALQAGQSDLLLEKASVRDANSRPLTVEIENAALSVR